MKTCDYTAQLIEFDFVYLFPGPATTESIESRIKNAD